MLRDMAARWNVRSQGLAPSGKTSLTLFGARWTVFGARKTRFKEHQEGQTEHPATAFFFPQYARAREIGYLNFDTATMAGHGDSRGDGVRLQKIAIDSKQSREGVEELPHGVVPCRLSAWPRRRVKR